ncbi:MAG TPA: 1-(5-phosphoribosyl)-5-[(5-phosphoribosylamino)methylideneamino]imidazole-4-carboxamide isomerase [Thermomicrobiales bacterium]|nr:1-(5-phosphoribosyl)-5-[(5-phosphoribosylamino)methylideneamino]imidazole-4-carboxamide isomerase [Thermomicrobiales bacterium]
MIIYPAIDLRDGKAVRLVEGDFSKETVFDANPVEAARRWQNAGAEWLHVVDLDGARSGSTSNASAVAAIRSAVDIPIELGGGIRTIEAAERAFAMGIDRVILGTAAVEHPEMVADLVAKWGDRVAVGLDARDGKLATDGWLAQSERTALDVAAALRQSGVATFIVTDIHKDGKLQGPNLAMLKQAQFTLRSGVIASGGISTIEDVREVAAIGVDGAIIGRALYDGRIDLAEAIEAGRAERTANA